MHKAIVEIAVLLLIFIYHDYKKNRPEVTVNLDYKGLAIVIIVVGVVVGGAFSLGYKQGQNTPAMTNPPNTIASVPAQNTAMSNPMQEQDEMPLQDTLKLKPSGANFTHFRVGNSNVKGMLTDGNLVWVGTSGGVIRYDISTDDYKLYNVKNGSLLSNGVFHLSKLDQRIIVGTYGGGMSVYNTVDKTWKNYNIPDGLADQFMYDLKVTANGDIWIATWSGVNLVKGGLLDDPTKWENFTLKNTNGGLPNDWVYGVEEGKNGEMWFGTEGGLARYKDGKWENWKHKDGLGAAYEVVKADISFYNDPAKTSRHHAQQKAEQGLQDIKVGFNPNYIVSMAVDRDGNVWCGTWGGGLAHFNGKSFTNYTVKDGIPGNHIFMLNIDQSDGRLWIGTNKGLARPKKDNKGFSVLTRAEGLYADNVFSMTKAQDGTLWVGSYGGVARIKNYSM